MTPNPASMSRRRFVSTAGAAVIAAPMFAQAASAASTEKISPATRSPDGAGKKPYIGLELYSVRGELQRDLPGTLRAVAKMGYQVAEFFSPYVSWTFAYAKD